MKYNTMRFLKVSLALVVLLCVVVFTFLAYYMNYQSSATISEIGTIYMAGLNERISMHFETTIDYNLNQIEDIIHKFPPESTDYGTLAENMGNNALERGFLSLALYAEDGTFEMLRGEQIQVTDPEPFFCSMQNREKKVAVGTDKTGNNIVLIGLPAAYEMEDGGKSLALVATLSVDYFKRILALDIDDTESLVYSHVIRKDGSFVIHSSDAHLDNYFDRLRNLYQGENQAEAEQHITDLYDAMQKNEPYSVVYHLPGERRHLYCTSLPNSEWYLVTAMPYGQLDEVVSSMGNTWTSLVLGGCALILIVLGSIFVYYFRLTRQQMVELDNARKTAEKSLTMAVDARRDAEKAQRAAEHANKAKSEFLSNMSHDIRTPMNAIVGMTAIATANIENRQQVQHCLKKISLSSQHLLGLINDVLDMSKIESGKMTLNIDQVSLREVMDSIVSIVQPQVKAKHQNFNVCIYDISAENVCCDSVRLNQVLLNFLSNAIKFTPEGGTIQITLRETESPKGAEYVRILLQVKDTGMGMSEEFKEKIFDSFTREDNTRIHRTEGTGLGMAITKYIVDAMGGTIQVESQQGVGTEFNVTLDFEKAEVAEVDMVLPPWNMLVVDDDQQLCESTASALQSIGIKADWVLSGEEAVEMVVKKHQRREDYQVILLDWKLPGMDGISTAKAIHARMEGDIPILLISAYDWGEIEDEARQAGITGFISKPLFKSTLFYGLKKFADGKEEGEPKEESPHHAIDFNGKHVLLAEDNELNWEIAEELLTDLGLQLDHAENGQICVEMLQNSQPGHYSAVLMDIRMPVMTGYEAAVAIRKLDHPDANLPIIAMTADAFSEDIKHCLDCGMNAHVAKPIDVREVARLLEKYMEN